MAVYLIGQLRVQKWDWYQQYQEVTEKLVRKYDGKYLVKAARLDQLEGSRSVPSAVVVIEFPSKEHAQQWYQDPDYQPMIELRKFSEVDTELLLADGFSG
jgi:uncharacterized protein (DUF1330 family)